MRKIKILPWLMVCALILSSCQVPFVSDLVPDKEKYDAESYRSEYESRWQYQQLNDDEQRHYGYLYAAVQETKDTDSYVQLDGKKQPGVRVELPDAELDNEGITRLYEAFFTDNPQFFYLDRTYSMEGIQNLRGETRYNTLILRYTSTAKQRMEAEQELQAVVDDIMAQCPQSDDYDTERYLHDRVITRCTYDEYAAKHNSSAAPNAYTAYGALVEGKAVCEGYAKAMQLLLQKAAIPVTLATGISKESGESHMWNVVTIHGENYHLDATWDDNLDQPQYTFFNLTTEMVQHSCIIDNPETLPPCTATADNPCVRNDTLIDTYERQEIARKIAARIRAGDTTIQLRFTEGKLDNGLLFLKNQTLLNTMVNSQLSAMGSQLSMWDYDLWSDRDQQVLTIIKKNK